MFLLIYNFYLRFLAIICFCLSTFYWICLVGVFSEPLWHFDLMLWQWQLLSSALAIIYPIALVGLWMYSPWGIVLWCIAALTETLSIYYFNNSICQLLALLHGILFLIFIILKITLIILKRNKIINNIVTDC
ncbi:DUF6163 family protein [Bartonella sp. B41]